MARVWMCPRLCAKYRRGCDRMTGQKYYKFVTRELTDGQTRTIDYSRIGEWISCDDITDADINGKACGHGLHLAKIPNPRYCHYEIGFLAEGRYLMGEDEEKARFAEVRLIRPLKFSEIFFPGANLRNADLRGANLSFANLEGADLGGAIVKDVKIFGAAGLSDSIISQIKGEEVEK